MERQTQASIRNSRCHDCTSIGAHRFGEFGDDSGGKVNEDEEKLVQEGEDFPKVLDVVKEEIFVKAGANEASACVQIRAHTRTSYVHMRVASATWRQGH